MKELQDKWIEKHAPKCGPPNMGSGLSRATFLTTRTRASNNDAKDWMPTVSDETSQLSVVQVPERCRNGLCKLANISKKRASVSFGQRAHLKLAKPQRQKLNLKPV